LALLREALFDGIAPYGDQISQASALCR